MLTLTFDLFSCFLMEDLLMTCTWGTCQTPGANAWLTIDTTAVLM